jgi:hypothetical protein
VIPTDRAFKYAEDEISSLSDAACVTVAVGTSEKGRTYTVTAPGFGPIVRFTITAQVLSTDKKSALLDRVRALWEETMRLVWDNVRKMVPPTPKEQAAQEEALDGALKKVGLTIPSKLPGLSGTTGPFVPIVVKPTSPRPMFRASND